MFDSGGQPY